MPFRLAFSEEAESQLRKLDNVAAKRVLARLESAVGDPTHFFERLAGREEYKLRAGDYRVIAKILAGEDTIFVLSLGHRKNIYKRLAKP